MVKQKQDVAAAGVVTLEVSVDDLSLNTVVGEHRAYVMGGEDWDGYWETQPATVLDLVVDRLVVEVMRDGGLKAAVEKIRNEVVKEVVTKTVTEAMHEEFTPMTAYGEKAGEKTTLRGVIVQLAERALTLRVKRDGYSSSPQETLAEQVIRQMVDGVFVKELQSAAQAEKSKVVAAMREQGAALIAKMLEAGLPGGR